MSTPCWLKNDPPPPPVEAMTDEELLVEWAANRNAMRGVVVAEEYMKRRAAETVPAGSASVAEEQKP